MIKYIACKVLKYIIKYIAWLSTKIYG